MRRFCANCLGFNQPHDARFLRYTVFFRHQKPRNSRPCCTTKQGRTKWRNVDLIQSDSTPVVSNSSSCTDKEHIFCCRWHPPCESHKETSMRAHPQKVEQAFMALTELDAPQVNIWGYAKHEQCTLGRKF